MKFINRLINRLESTNSNVCVGLDSRYDRIPKKIKTGKSISQSILDFNKHVIKSTHDVTSAYKMNVSFYSGFGQEGLKGLKLTNEWIKSEFPNIPLIADCKRSEMGESVSMVKKEIFDWLNFDCIMVTPWFGSDTIKDYLINEAHGVCVYVHNSNPSASEFQDLILKDGKKLYEIVARNIASAWNKNGNVFVEAGATYPTQLKTIRKIVGVDMVILTAGIGAQGAKTTDLPKNIWGTNRLRLLVNSSRGIIFAGEGQKDYFQAVRNAALTLKNELAR